MLTSLTDWTAELTCLSYVPSRREPPKLSKLSSVASRAHFCEWTVPNGVQDCLRGSQPNGTTRSQTSRFLRSPFCWPCESCEWDRFAVVVLKWVLDKRGAGEQRRKKQINCWFYRRDCGCCVCVGLAASGVHVLISTEVSSYCRYLFVLLICNGRMTDVCKWCLLVCFVLFCLWLSIVWFRQLLHTVFHDDLLRRVFQSIRWYSQDMDVELNVHTVMLSLYI